MYLFVEAEFDKLAAPESVELFESLGEIGITPVFFEKIGYDRSIGEYTTKDDSNQLETITATKFREAIIKGETVPDWFVRKPVQELLASELRMGRKIFHGQ